MDGRAQKHLTLKKFDSAESPTLEIPIISKAAKDGSLAVKWVLKERKRTAEAGRAN